MKPMCATCPLVLRGGRTRGATHLRGTAQSSQVKSSQVKSHAFERHRLLGIDDRDIQKAHQRLQPMSNAPHLTHLVERIHLTSGDAMYKNSTPQFSLWGYGGDRRRAGDLMANQTKLPKAQHHLLTRAADQYHHWRDLSNHTGSDFRKSGSYWESHSASTPAREYWPGAFPNKKRPSAVTTALS